ncbi:MAG: NAD-dependent epimerase/dehydratase family protein [Candidatus Kariarchaeaceae archaeon]|jgi:nucleoside-diphosphate-sugar epimerase
MEKELHVVFGASGGIGNAVIQILVKQGKMVRGINRSGIAKVPKGVEMFAADLSDLDDSVKASEGATHIYNCVNAMYDKWSEIYPDVTYKFVELLKITSAKGIIVDNLYMYGEEVSEPYREDMEYLAEGKKGKLRAKSAKIYEAAIENGQISALICRGPDFYGPGVTKSSFYGDRVFPKVLKGKGVQVIGELDKPHAMIYVFDYARAIVKLANEETAYNQIWHAPMAEPLSQEEYLRLAYELAGTSGKISSTPKIMLKFLGVFIPIIREVKEMMYEWDKPYYVNSDKYVAKYGKSVTSHEKAMLETLEWYRTEFNNN